MSKEFVIKEITKELMNQGLVESTAKYYARQAAVYYNKSVCNSKNPFKDTLDYTGKLAERDIKAFRYKPPKQKTSRRNKKPQEAFRFD